MKPLFPGMDPYLEAPGIWPGFHDSFLAYTRETLQPLLPERYYADLRTREEIGIVGFQAGRVIYSDVAVRETGAASPDSSTSQTVSDGRGAPEHLVIPSDEPLKVSYLEIREVTDDLLVTLIELLSPSNKLPGDDREAFERKQREILASETNWVEIDLLRSGKRLGCHPRVDLHCRAKGYDYVVVVSRSSKRDPLDLEIYGFTVRDRFPVISIPLGHPDPDLRLDLGHVFHRAYETGPYRKIVRYDGPPSPDLPEEDALWVKELLRDERVG